MNTMYLNFIFLMGIQIIYNPPFSLKNWEPQDRKKKVLFIDASNDYIARKNQNTLGNKCIDKIISTYQNYAEIEKYSAVVDVQILKDNDFNMNISRYVDTTVEVDAVDIPAVLADLTEIKEKNAQTEEKLNSYLKKLGFDEI